MPQRILFLFPTLEYALVSFCFRFQTGNNEEAENESYPFPDLSDAAERLVKIDEVIEPDQEWVDRYEKIYPFYKEIFLHLDQDLRGLRTVVERLDM